jgi:uncharacterized protein involved in type VI secretion and phage assembly
MATPSYRAQATIQIDGQPVPDHLQEDIMQIVVEESLHLPSVFTLVVRNDFASGRSQDKPWQYKDLLQIGKLVKIGFTSSTTESVDFDEEDKGTIIEGEITAIEAHFNESTQAPIVVRGYDISHRLHRGRYNRSFQNMTDTDIVKKIIREVGIKPGTIDESKIPHDYVFQENQTNMEFLRQRAGRIGFELFVQDGKLFFRNPKADAGELPLKWLVDLHSFKIRMTSLEQVKEVEVRAWDYSQKKAIVATAQTGNAITENQNGKGRDTPTKFNGLPAKHKMLVVDQPLFIPKEADVIAQALCDELEGQFIYADAKAEGNPKIRPGRVVKLRDMGPYDGKYYITETRHSFIERVYKTEFSVRGLRSGDMLAVLAPTSRPQPGHTLLVGVVTDNEDPQDLGRVKVKFPTLTDDHASNWARVVSIGAGDRRGFDCLPEINDEVLVGFEHGDIHRPYVIGGVWNGKDAPPNKVSNNVQNGKVRLRTFRTRTGHQIQLVEEDKSGQKAGVYIETKGGHQIQLIENGQKAGVRIETKGGHQIEMTDSDRTLTISSAGNMKIDAKGNLDIHANGNLDINANGMITVKGTLIKLN